MRKTEAAVIKIGAAHYDFEVAGGVHPIKRSERHLLTNALCDALGIGRPHTKPKRKHKTLGTQHHKGENHGTAKGTASKPSTEPRQDEHAAKKRRRKRRTRGAVPVAGVQP